MDFAVRYRKDKLDVKRKYDIFVLGRSMGGAVAIYSSTIEQFSSAVSGYILENTFTSISDMLGSMFQPLTIF